MTAPGPPERRAFRFSMSSPGILEGALIPYDVPLRIGGAFEEIWEPHCLLMNHIQANVRHDRRQRRWSHTRMRLS